MLHSGTYMSVGFIPIYPLLGCFDATHFENRGFDMRGVFLPKLHTLTFTLAYLSVLTSVWFCTHELLYSESNIFMLIVLDSVLYKYNTTCTNNYCAVSIHIINLVTPCLCKIFYKCY